jgi:2-polyprenyl-6-methoxyphenol hydroxylase-like FAD-dependent oxidoreductase
LSQHHEVFERVPSITPRGAGLRLEVNGAKALEAIDLGLYKKALDASCSPTTFLQYDKEGTASIEPPSIH